MDANWIIEGLMSYLGLIVLLTFHEFGHAWTAEKCGDDTARLQGRCSLNPMVHIDPIGTVLLPLGAYQNLTGHDAMENYRIYSPFINTLLWLGDWGDLDSRTASAVCQRVETAEAVENTRFR